MNPIKWKLHWQIFLSLSLAAFFGLFLLPKSSGTFANATLYWCQFLGALFMNALKMVVVPLVIASIIAGVMRLGGEKSVGRMSIKTIAYYTLSGVVAASIGLLVVNYIGPGHIDAETARILLDQGSQTASKEGLMLKVDDKSSNDLIEVFLRMFPQNVVQAATSNGQLLGVIVFCVIFGFFIGKLPPEMRETQFKFWDSTQTVILKMTEVIIRFAPIGVFGLVTPKFFEAPVDKLVETMLLFSITVVIALALHFFISLGLALHFFAKVPAGQHYKKMAPVLLTAFSTASSSATLPLTMDTVHERTGVSKRTCSFTLPLGATVNMDGTALYECIVVIFISQLLASTGGVALDVSQQLLVVFLALTTSIGVAGIPSASLVAIAIILPVVGLPIEAIGVIWVTDRLLDMLRTAVNVFSDTVGAVIIATSEGESLELENETTS